MSLAFIASEVSERMKTVERTCRRRLPLFVLPTVLFPGGRIPLHVFEVRYRQMVARCLEYDRRFSLLFHREDLHGPLHVEAGRVGCVAEIASLFWRHNSATSRIPTEKRRGGLLMREGARSWRALAPIERTGKKLPDPD